MIGPESTQPEGLFEVEEPGVKHPFVNKGRTICVAIDDTKEGQFALDWALKHVAKSSEDVRDEIVLIHIRQAMHHNFGSLGLAGDLVSERSLNMREFEEKFDQSVNEDSHELLRRCGRRVIDHNLICRAIALRGDIRDEILDKVKELKADMLVVGSRSQSLLNRTLLGSVSDHLVHHASCPVIVAKFH